MTECTDDLEWHGLYHSDSRFKKYIDPKTFAHPAKMSMELCDHIFKHLEKLGLLKPNDTVIDFMSGTGRSNIVASLHGYKSIGVELESHFIEMQNDNKKQVAKQMQKEPNWEIVQGDARKLSELLTGKGVGIMSPPYSEAHNEPGGFVNTNRQDLKKYLYTKNNNIGIVSPPYADAISKQGGEIHLQNVGESQKQSRRYGRDEAQIGNLPDKVVGITSPPYDNKPADQRAISDPNWSMDNLKTFYNESKSQENIGSNATYYGGDNTYLGAMYSVYSESYKAGISPLTIVLKCPTKKGKLRRIDLDTIKILKDVGYKILCIHRAILFEEFQQKKLDGGIRREAKGRLSFFKRMSFAKGTGEIAKWEDIITAVIE